MSIRTIYLGIYILGFFLSCTGEPIKMYTFYTPSHAIFKNNWFCPSIKDNYEIIIKQYPQECPSGKYRSHGWVNTMMRKVNLILEAIEENQNKIFIYADIDIQFFKPTEPYIMQYMKNKDIVFQRESPTGDIGTGFFACKGNNATKNLWLSVKKFMINHPGKTDQLSINALLRKLHTCSVVWDYLPESFFAGGTLTGTLWLPGEQLKIPKDIVLHHANSTIGIANKLEQLSLVYTHVNHVYHS